MVHGQVSYLPTPKSKGHISMEQTSPKQGTRTGSMQARNINSSENGA